jgi:hypothetical protein
MRLTKTHECCGAIYAASKNLSPAICAHFFLRSTLFIYAVFLLKSIGLSYQSRAGVVVCCAAAAQHERPGTVSAKLST